MNNTILKPISLKKHYFKPRYFSFDPKFTCNKFTPFQFRDAREYHLKISFKKILKFGQNWGKTEPKLAKNK